MIRIIREASMAVKMSRDDFDRMCRENGILQGLSRSDYIEIRDLFYSGYEDFDAAVNDLWYGDDSYHSRYWYANLLRKYIGKVNESVKGEFEILKQNYLEDKKNLKVYFFTSTENVPFKHYVYWFVHADSEDSAREMIDKYLSINNEYSFSDIRGGTRITKKEMKQKIEKGSQYIELTPDNFALKGSISEESYSVNESLKESSDDSTKKYLIKKAQKVSSGLTGDAWISDQFVKSKGTRILLNIPIAKDIDSAHATEAEAHAMKVYDTNDVWWDDFVLQVDVTNWFEDGWTVK